MIKVNFPSNVLQLMSYIRSLVMFDFLSNPWELDATTVLNFDVQGELDHTKGLTDQIQQIGYERTNSIQILGFVFLVLIAYLFQIVYTLLVYAYWKITGKSEKYAKEKLDKLVSDILSIILECYIEFLIGGYLQVNNSLNTNPVEIISTAVGYFILVVALIMVPLASIHVLA
jgi:hypothetical protein